MTIEGLVTDWLQWFTVPNVLIALALTVAWSMAVIPRYNVWRAHKAGEADLAKAKNEQLIQLARAEARLHAAEANKKAAIIEAEAVAEQINKIGSGLSTHDLYLRWQWIKMMEEKDTDNTVVYVPTEAGLPILEARRKP